jgi:hypothetical protein
MTEKSNSTRAGFAELEAVIERFGSDRTRWPAPERLGFATLLSESPEARKRLREAEALDRLLDLVPAPAVETSALADRIMAKALAERASSGQRSKRPAPRGAGAGSGAAASNRMQWPAVAALAASLLVGAFSGLSGALDSSVGTLVADASYATSDSEIDPGQIALDSDSLSMFEEESL